MIWSHGVLDARFYRLQADRAIKRTSGSQVCGLAGLVTFPTKRTARRSRKAILRLNRGAEDAPSQSSGDIEAVQATLRSENPVISSWEPLADPVGDAGDRACLNNDL